jgi:hypothetical protein
MQLRAVCDTIIYMTKALQEAFAAASELSDDAQDAIADQLMRLVHMDTLDEDWDAICLRRRLS